MRNQFYSAIFTTLFIALLTVNTTAQIRTLPTKKTADSVKVKRNITTTTQPVVISPTIVSTNYNLTQSMVMLAPQSFTPTVEVLNSLRWWRSINPGDFSSYQSPFKLVQHSMYDTTAEKFAGKQSLSFNGWLYKEGWPFWKSDSLVHLVSLKNLVQIELPQIFVNDTAFQYLGSINNLKAVYNHSGTAYCNSYRMDHVTDNGLILLLRNRNMEHIGFQGLYRITDRGFTSFKNMTQLKTLYTHCWSGITDQALLSLEGCTSLETLYFIESNISDAGLNNLLSIRHTLPNLKKIYLNYSRTTVTGVTNFINSWGKYIEVVYR